MTSAAPSCDLSPEERWTEQTACDRAETEQHHAWSGVAGREPAHHEIHGDRGPEGGRCAAREEQREEHEQGEHEDRAWHRRAARDIDLTLEPVGGRDGPAVVLHVERVRGLQGGARDVGDRHEARHAREARDEQSVVAVPDDRNRVAAVVRRRCCRWQADDDHRTMGRNLRRLRDVDQHPVVRPRQARVVQNAAHHPCERGSLARPRSRVRDHQTDRAFGGELRQVAEREAFHDHDSEDLAAVTGEVV